MSIQLLLLLDFLCQEDSSILSCPYDIWFTKCPALSYKRKQSDWEIIFCWIITKLIQKSDIPHSIGPSSCLPSLILMSLIQLLQSPFKLTCIHITTPKFFWHILLFYELNDKISWKQNRRTKMVLKCFILKQIHTDTLFLAYTKSRLSKEKDKWI